MKRDLATQVILCDRDRRSTLTAISYSVMYAGISSWSLVMALYRCSTPGSWCTFALIAGAMKVRNHQVIIWKRFSRYSYALHTLSLSLSLINVRITILASNQRLNTIYAIHFYKYLHIVRLLTPSSPNHMMWCDSCCAISSIFTRIMAKMRAHCAKMLCCWHRPHTHTETLLRPQDQSVCDVICVCVNVCHLPWSRTSGEQCRKPSGSSCTWKWSKMLLRMCRL